VPGLLYRPHQVSADNKAPALVLVHGGPGGQAQVGYFALTQALVNHGYVVYDINNRGSSGYGKTFFAMDDRKHGEADLADVVASKAMLVATGYVDPERIGIIGGSYGGYMVPAALTLQPAAFKVESICLASRTGRERSRASRRGGGAHVTRCTRSSGIGRPTRNASDGSHRCFRPSRSRLR